MLKLKQESFDYLGKLSYRKIMNILKVVFSFYISRIIRRAVIWGNPISLSIEPTTSCNLRCPECPSGLRSFTRPTGMLQFDLFKKIVDDQFKTLSYLLLYFQGEPFLNPRFNEMVNYAAEKDIYTATSTNAHYLDDETAKNIVQSGLDKLIISIDGTTQDTYDQYRIGGSLEKVLEGTRNMVRWKKVLKSKTPRLVFQFLVVRPNEHQLDELQALAHDIGVDEVKFKTAQLYNYEDGHELMPSNEKYSRYRVNKKGKYELKNKLYNHCWKMWHSAVITWDGTIVPCCFDKDADHPLGSIIEHGFMNVWQSDQYNSFRQRLLNGRRNIDICKNCTEGTRVWT